MAKKLAAFLSFLLIIIAVFWSIFGERPAASIQESTDSTKFSVNRAFKHVETIGQEPHYVGNSAHREVRRYLVEELESLGLEVEVQVGWTLNHRGTLTKAYNILARKHASAALVADSPSTLLLLSHYDSAVHSSPGASDAASGLATILESMRAFLAAGTNHSNDILIAFTDAEEVGLNGASLLLEHPWAQEIGLALNFEARGSGGSSFMLLETNHGNRELIQHFMQAGVNYPVANSLMYSIYKLLPNDTDLTVLREQQDIHGFNFAFIGDHFDYHTATDTPENLDIRTLAHQGSYLMPLLNYFSNQPLNTLDAIENSNYFSIPVLRMIQYPVEWSLPLLILAGIFFLLLLLYGLLKKLLYPRDLLEGMLPLLMALLLSGGFAFVVWELCMLLYPQYHEMEHGFSYNGYYYIWAIIMGAVGICFYTFHRFQRSTSPAAIFVAPLFVWLLLSALAVFFFEGASYFIILVYFGLIQFVLLLRNQKPNLLLMSFLSLPAIFLLMPLIVTVPVPIGLKSLFLSAVLLVLLWTLLWPVFGYYRKKQYVGLLSLLTFVTLFLIAHFKADFNAERPRPNSLVYLQDVETGLATWHTYDRSLDSWTAPFFPDTEPHEDVRVHFSSKYNSGFSRSAQAPKLELKDSEIAVRMLADSIGLALYQIDIIPHKDVDRIELFTQEVPNFASFRVNGLTAAPLPGSSESRHVFTSRWTNRLLTYYATGPDTLKLEFTINNELAPRFILYEASYDLLENDELRVPAREDNMIPRPFVLTDVIVRKQEIELSEASQIAGETQE